MSNSQVTVLTPAKGYNPKDRMIFSAPVSGKVPDTTIEYKRINISTRNEDGTEGELVFPTSRLFSFGVSINEDPQTKKITGYTFPLCLWSRDGPTQEEKEWIETFDKVVDCCIDHLVDNKEEADLFDLERSDLTKSKGGLNPLYWKKEKVTDPETGKMVLRKVEGLGPTLYTKLIYSKKKDKFLTMFYDRDNNPIDARDLMGKYCHAEGAVKIESIFISGTGKISLQTKLYEAVVELSDSGMKRLLRPQAESKVLAAKNARGVAALMGSGDNDDEDEKEEKEENNNDDEDSEGSLVEEPPKSKTVPVKRVVRRVVKKVS